MRCLAHSIESLIRETESNLGSESGLATGGAGHVLQPSTDPPDQVRPAAGGGQHPKPCQVREQRGRLLALGAPARTSGNHSTLLRVHGPDRTCRASWRTSETTWCSRWRARPLRWLGKSLTFGTDLAPFRATQRDRSYRRAPVTVFRSPFRRRGAGVQPFSGHQAGGGVHGQRCAALGYQRARGQCTAGG
jgi:hypothetical protein